VLAVVVASEHIIPILQQNKLQSHKNFLELFDAEIGRYHSVILVIYLVAIVGWIFKLFF